MLAVGRTNIRSRIWKSGEPARKLVWPPISRSTRSGGSAMVMPLVIEKLLAVHLQPEGLRTRKALFLKSGGLRTAVGGCRIA